MLYQLPSEAAGEEVLRKLETERRVERSDEPATVVVYYDTFDWRLDRAGGALATVPAPGGGTFLEWRRRGSPTRRLLVDSPPAFAWDLEPGDLRAELEPIVEMRRLLPLVEVERRGRTLHVLDELEKTVVRVRLETHRAGEPGQAERVGLPVTLRVLGLLGYEGERREIVDLLESGFGLEPLEGNDLTQALAAVGRRRRDYSSKLRLKLRPSTPAREATLEILRTLFATLKHNEDGTRRDLDSEFLHDFRVAVRRTRSALSQLKGVLPDGALECFKPELSWLGTVTGPTRDMDVYLLKIDAYEVSLPEEVRPDLEPLREFLRRHQEVEQRRLAEALGSPRYRALTEAWGRFLEGPVAGESPSAERPIGELAAERIWKTYRRVWRKGRAIDEDTPAAALHRLRIDCKKLRYLLEFFRNLWARAEVDPLIEALKQLQDNLGDYNDLEVQQEKLRGFALRMEEEGLASVATLLAMGELVAGLRRMQEEERRRFHRCFAHFARRAHRHTFKRLFAAAG